MFPPVDPLTAFGGGDNMPDAGGGTPHVPLTGSLPSVSGSPPTAPPDYATVMQQLQPPPLSNFQRALRVALPAIAASFALASKNRGAALGSFAQHYAAGEQANELDTQRAALVQERNAKAYKDMLAEWGAQRKIDATAQKEELTRQAAADKEHRALIRQVYDRISNTPGSENIQQTLNALQDTQGPQAVQQYLQSTQTLEDGTKVPLSEVMRFGTMAPDGVHFIGGKAKEPKEVIAGTSQEQVERGRRIAIAKNRGKPLTDEMQKAVDLATLDEFKRVGPAGDMIEMNTALKKIELRIEGLKEQQLLDAMTPAARVSKQLGPAATQLSDTDVTLHEIERLHDMLKIHGLNANNNPIGPRTAAVEAGLGINPGDLAGDIVQSANFAKMKAYSAQGRGNAGRSVAMLEQMAKHLTSGTQTYSQLYAVTDDLLREFYGIRHETLRSHGVTDEQYPYEHRFSNGKVYVGQHVTVKGVPMIVGEVGPNGAWNPR